MRSLVLAYHGFGERSRASDPHNLFVPLDAFTHQIDRLLSLDWIPLDVSSYLRALDRPDRGSSTFLITIDDGFVSTLDAAQVLASRGVPALLFMPAGLIGGSSRTWVPEMADEPLLDAAGLQAAVELGVEVGVHGWDHTTLDGMDAAMLRRNTVEARAALADAVGAEPRTFAYPSGVFDDRARQAVEAAGFAAAFAVDRSDGRYALPRIDINATDTPRTFAMKCSRWWPAARAVGQRLPRLRRRLHTIAGSAR